MGYDQLCHLFQGFSKMVPFHYSGVFDSQPRQSSFLIYHAYPIFLSVSISDNKTVDMQLSCSLRSKRHLRKRLPCFVFPPFLAETLAEDLYSNSDSRAFSFSKSSHRCNSQHSNRYTPPSHPAAPFGPVLATLPAVVKMQDRVAALASKFHYCRGDPKPSVGYGCGLAEGKVWNHLLSSSESKRGGKRTTKKCKGNKSGIKKYLKFPRRL